ncbi:hypothetical protein [Paraburkholderia antibiotica]|uniref:Lipoprotein n=1 Tax=Paraburkholderia antibiotica TaxID=2728839 RepID=A0A7X9ZVJ8_9BURK|nr:hypothetical protein [Paraburkholderia antibiotica]NML29736.1 hypothetical protein [Paraburkholderia antibiotica]
MKIRILSIVCVASAAGLLPACTIANRNSGACEQLMRSKLAETSSDTLRVTHRGAAIRGSRVVVEGSIEHVVSASDVAASAAVVASAPVAASAALVASEPRASSAPLAASAAQAASEVKVAAKPAAPKRINTPAAAECTFHGEELDVFRWLAPAKLATPVVATGDAG